MNKTPALPERCLLCGDPVNAAGRFGDGQDAHLSLRCPSCGDLVFPACTLAVRGLAHPVTIQGVAEAVARWRERHPDEALVMQAWHFVDAPEVLERLNLTHAGRG